MTVTIGAATIVGALRTSSTAATAAPSRTLALAALITWIIDAGSGGYMLRTWIARGGLRRQRAIDRLAPRVVFAHFGMASTGLLVWVSYLATRWIVLAWVAVGLLMLVIGLGVSTVTVWTPFPAHRSSTAGPAGAGAAGAGAAGAGAAGAGAAGAGAGGAGAAGGGAAGGGAAGAGATAGEPDGGVFGGPAEGELTVTDEMLSRALTDEALLSRLVEDVVARARSHPAKSARRARAHAATLIPAGHGVAAIATMILAVLTAAGATR